MSGSMPLTVSCVRTDPGWRCDVRVGDDPSATAHVVTVSEAELERYAPGSTDPERLVRESFRFLLEREPRESVMATFTLPVIERYFAGYPAEILARVREAEDG